MRSIRPVVRPWRSKARCRSSLTWRVKACLCSCSCASSWAGCPRDDCCVMLADDGVSAWWLQNVPWRGLDADGFVQTVDRFLAVAQDLAPGFDPIADRADDGEPARRMPPELGLRG